MAKMFYTLEEAAEKLGVGEDAIKEMAGQGKVQQFRDRDKLMFKRDQIDSLAASADDSGAELAIDDGPSGDTDQIDLSSPPPSERKEDPRQATGVSVFDAGEVEPADPMAQTQVTDSMVDDEELALESVGSGSGLLDLTRESDDTSLGAELLDEIYPGGEASDAKLDVPSSSGAFTDGGLQIEPSGPSGLENLQQSGAPMPAMAAAPEPYDPAGSWMSAGFLLGSMAVLVLGMFFALSLVTGTPITLTKTLAGEPGSSSLMMASLLMALGCIVLGAVGFIIGKMTR